MVVWTIHNNYVTGFWKADWIVTLDLFHFIGPANGYTCTLHIHNAINRLGWLVCFSRATFADPVSSWLRQCITMYYYIEGMGLKFTPVIGRHLLRHLSRFGPMAGTSGTIASPNSPNRCLVWQNLFNAISQKLMSS